MPHKNFLKDIHCAVLISRDVSRAALRERMMYGFLLLAFLFILMANVPFAINDPKAFQGMSANVAAIQIGFVSINIFTLLITVFVSLTTLQSYLNKNRLVLLLSKPLKRWQIAEGVVFGLFKMVFLNWFLMTSGIWLVILSQTRELGLYIWAGMSVTALMSLLYVSLVVFFYMMIPNAVAGVLSIFVLIAGFGVPFAREIFSDNTHSVFVSFLLKAGLEILPKINELWGISMIELGLFKLEIPVFGVIIQTFVLIFILNFITCIKFRRFCRT